MNSEATSPDATRPDTSGAPRLSPAWDLATRDTDGMMATVVPTRMQPEDWSTVSGTVTAIMAAAFDEASEWSGELSFTINPVPVADVPLDFIEVDLDGRFPWHATNATFMAPSGRVAKNAETTLRDAGWQGVGTGGPVYKVWDDIALVDVAAQITNAALAVFPPEHVGAWEVSVTVLAPEDDTETSYEVVASATRAVLRRTVADVAGVSPGHDEWVGACRVLGFDPADLETSGDHDAP